MKFASASPSDSASVGSVSSVYPALIDCGSSLNLVNDSVIAEHSLAEKVAPCQTTKVTLADGTSSMISSRSIQLSFTIAGVKHEDVFLVVPIGTQPILLGMLFLERVNPDVDWRIKTLSPHRSPTSSSVPHSTPNPRIHLVNQLYINPEDEVYLFHVYNHAINLCDGLPDVYHDLANVFKEKLSDEFVTPASPGRIGPSH
jgi:hypothetical protein